MGQQCSVTPDPITSPEMDLEVARENEIPPLRSLEAPKASHLLLSVEDYSSLFSSPQLLWGKKKKVCVWGNSLCVRYEPQINTVAMLSH